MTSDLRPLVIKTTSGLDRPEAANQAFTVAAAAVAAGAEVSQRLTDAPAATAAAATVKAWFVASGRSVPDVVLITRGRVGVLTGTG